MPCELHPHHQLGDGREVNLGQEKQGKDKMAGTKIYFAASIRAGRGDVDIYSALVSHLKSHGKVLTEHVGDVSLHKEGEIHLTDEEIYKRDMDWLRECDVLVAEVSTPSLGVGYEIREAERLGKRSLCLYRPQEGKRLSGIISGSGVAVRNYGSLEEATRILDSFFSEFSKSD